MNWLVIPLLQGYDMAGEFQTTEKMYRSIIMNIPFYLLYFFSFVGLLGFIYFIDNRDDDSENNILSGQGILGVMIGMSLAFGNFLLVLFLGYSFVKIPISYWTESKPSEKIKRLLFKIAVFNEQIPSQQSQVNKLINILS